MPDIDALVADLTLEEKIDLVGGRDLWTTPGVERLGVAPLKVTDGPNGARGARFTEGPSSACFPCGTALGATWDPGLTERIGAALGDEARTKGAQVLLAPTINIHRSPLAGRNFECYSEDPFLSARMAAAYISGVQSRRVGTAVKHFVCNDSEFERHTISSEVDERTLREIYLPPFEAAIVEAGSWSLMSAYNRINGTYAAEHPLIDELLRREWGWDGFVISDWYGTKSTVESARAGLDLEMPGPPIYYGTALLDAVKNGLVDEAVLDDKVRRLLVLRERVGLFDGTASTGDERSEDDPQRRELIRVAARQAMVLLRNEAVAGAPALPLGADIRRIAVIGPNADPGEVEGGGSAGVRPHRVESPLDGIANRAGAAVEVIHERGCEIDRSIPPLNDRLLHDVTVAYYDNTDLDGEPVVTDVASRLHFMWWGDDAPAPVANIPFSLRVTGTLRARDPGEHTFSLTSVGRARLLIDGETVVDNWTSTERGESFFGRGTAEVTGVVNLQEGEEYDVTVEYSTEGRAIRGLTVGCRAAVPPDLLERAERAAAGADAAIVVVGLNSDWESEGRDRDSMDLPGAQDELVRRVAAANPRTIVVVNAGSPVHMPWAADVAALLYAWYPGQEFGYALADLVFGDASPSGRLPTTFPVRYEDNPCIDAYPGSGGVVAYTEGVFVGYRHYDARQVEPLFPFGFGLSYTAFDYGDVTAHSDDEGNVVVNVSVANVGDRAGIETVQVYVGDVESSVPRPPQELKGFARVDLAPGATEEVTITLDRRAFAFWDIDGHEWRVEPGDFELRVGSSSRDIKGTTTVTLAG